MLSLAQYYTSAVIGDGLISEFDTDAPQYVLDIGCGELGLLMAARRRWDQASLIGYDIDPENAHTGRAPKIELYVGDGADPDLARKVKETYGEIDVAVSNPPYIKLDYDLRIKRILSESGLAEAISVNAKQVPAELVFLAQNLLVLKPGAELGVILPAGFVSGEKWKPFREYLLSMYSVRSCIELPTDSFRATEVSAYALCLRNDSHTKKTRLCELGDNRGIVIGRDEAVNRMDFSFYAQKEFNVSRVRKLKERIEVYRGSITCGALKRADIKFLHSTSIRDVPELIDLGNNFIPAGATYAEAGDIVVVRVGSRCVGRVAYICSGRIVVSDCLMVVRSTAGKTVWEYVSSPSFRQAVASSALGAGAKYLTLTLLKDLVSGN